MSLLGVVGLGYVGLPLAVEFSKRFDVIGYDLSEEKVANYNQGIDPTGEVSSSDLIAAKRLAVTTDPSRLSQADYIIIAVPTPIDIAHQPDLGPLISASRMVGRHMKRGAVVIYESTVYPGGYRGGLHSGAGEAIQARMEAGFPCGLFAGAHQSW